METIVTSPAKTVRIGPQHPFVIIGERINPTGRKLLSAELAAGNFERVTRDAIAQVAAGAPMLDVNCGVPMTDEPALLAHAIELVQSVVDVPLCIDSSIVRALELGLAAYKGKPLVARYKAAVIGVANDESGISYDPAVRFAVAKKIVERAERYGIPRADVVIDPLAMPVGAVNDAGIALFQIVRRISEELGVNTCCGASNISFGLPNRHGINRAFLTMAAAAGMNCAITSATEASLREALLAADVMMGKDENCTRWLRHNRAADGSGGRRERRRAPAAE
jgi:5-methyltetrahydrofolate--homocysteine methyltransferase